MEIKKYKLAVQVYEKIISYIKYNDPEQCEIFFNYATAVKKSQYGVKFFLKKYKNKHLDCYDEKLSYKKIYNEIKKKNDKKYF